jgi:hypothetical protein
VTLISPLSRLPTVTSVSLGHIAPPLPDGRRDGPDAGRLRGGLGMEMDSVLLDGPALPASRVGL